MLSIVIVISMVRIVILDFFIIVIIIIIISITARVCGWCLATRLPCREFSGPEFLGVPSPLGDSTPPNYISCWVAGRNAWELLVEKLTVRPIRGERRIRVRILTFGNHRLRGWGVGLPEHCGVSIRESGVDKVGNKKTRAQTHMIIERIYTHYIYIYISIYIYKHIYPSIYLSLSLYIYIYTQYTHTYLYWTLISMSKQLRVKQSRYTWHNRRQVLSRLRRNQHIHDVSVYA